MTTYHWNKFLKLQACGRNFGQTVRYACRPETRLPEICSVR